MENKTMNEHAVVLINKEDVPHYQFVSYDVLDDAAARAQRKKDLERAMLLGNGEQVKISIVFLTTDGWKRVDTTVWAATDEAIMLKGGVAIPVHCIQTIRLL